MEAAGVDPGAEPLIADGQIHRFRGPNDKPGRKNCWYILFGGVGIFGSWRLGVEHTWTAGNGKPTTDDRQRVKEAQQKAEVERERARAGAAAKAQRIWNRARPIVSPDEHPYLLNKKIQAYAAKLWLGLLLVPMWEVASGTLVNLQMISADSSKRFLTGGRVSGCYYALSKQSETQIARIYIAEGFATAASIVEATDVPTAAAFNAGNLRTVAEALRKKYPKAKITLCADNDRHTEGNPGVTKATEAARAARASLAIASFPDGVEGTDFNDLALSQGTDAVREQIAAANRPPASEIPGNFKLTKDMVYVLRERRTRDGGIEIDEHSVCSRLDIVALTRDIHGAEWGRLLRFKDPDGRVHEWAMPAEMLAGDGAEYRARLWEQGLRIWPSREARYGLDEYISQCRPSARAQAVTRVGWHDGVFILPDETFGKMDGERTLYQSVASVAHAFNVRGSLEDWQREVAAPCSGNSRLMFALSMAFAAPLLYLTNDESGGFHLVGASSVGKTTALRAGGSVWGGSVAPAGYLRQWRATANGLEGVAALHCDMLLCLDELSEVSAREAGNIAYMLANGQGKARARRDGSARPAFMWRELFLSSGEITLADKVREDGRQKATAGQQVRVLDLPADAGAGVGLFEDLHGASNGRQFADQLRTATQAYYGTAARAFLTEIVKEAEKVADAVAKYRDDFIEEHCPATADGQVRRAATRFGLAAAAGELATAFTITGWNKGVAAWAGGACFKAWLAQRGHIGPAEIEAGIEQVRTFFALHGESRFSNGSHGHPVMNRAGFRREGHFWVFPDVFHAEISRGFDYRILAPTLAARGMLRPGSDGRLQRLFRSPDDNKPRRMFCFTQAVLGAEELTEQETRGEVPVEN